MDNSESIFPMTTKISTIVFICHCLLNHSYAGVSVDKLKEFQRQIDAFHLTDGRTPEQYYAKWIMDLSPEERAALLPIVRKERDSVHPLMPAMREEWNGLLAYLGDEEAMKMNIEDWRNHGAHFEVARAESGQLPLFLEPELFIQEAHKPGMGLRMRESFSVALLLLDYLAYNQNYPPAVRAWAARTESSFDYYRSDDPTPIRRVTRDWYRANEKLIRAKAYDQIKAGEELPPGRKPLLADGPPPSLPVILPPDNNATQRQDRPIRPNPAVAAPPSESDRKPVRKYIAVAVSITILLAIAIFFQGRLCRRKP